MLVDELHIGIWLQGGTLYGRPGRRERRRWISRYASKGTQDAFMRGYDH